MKEIQCTVNKIGERNVPESCHSKKMIITFAQNPFLALEKEVERETNQQNKTLFHQPNGSFIIHS